MDILKLKSPAVASGRYLDDIEPLIRENIQSLGTIVALDLPQIINKLFEFLSRLRGVEEQVIERIFSFREDFVQALLMRLLTDRAGGVDQEISPRPLQVMALMQLLFAARDVLLVAQTGFGKSLIFQAIGILTAKITIIVAPVKGLYDQFHQDILEIPGANPIVVSSETELQYAKPGQPGDIYNTIRTGSYTHIILGPEQLLKPEFRALIRDTHFRRRLGALVIDEAHCVILWSTFRQEYTQIHAFLRVVPREVRLFACTATLNLSMQRQIVQKIGFNQRPQWNDERMSFERQATDRIFDLSLSTCLPTICLRGYCSL